MNIKEIIDAQEKIEITFKDGTLLIGEKRGDRYESMWFEKLGLSLTADPKGILPEYLRVIYFDDTMEKVIQRAIDERFDTLPNKRIA